MKAWPAALVTAMAAQHSTLVACVKITLADGTIVRMTDNILDLTIDCDVYQSTQGVIPTAVTSDRTLSPGTMEIVTYLGGDLTIGAALLRQFDGATVDAFMVDYTNLAAGKAYLYQGWSIGNLKQRDQELTLEIRSLAARLQKQVREIYSPSCRASLGDARCGLSVAALQVTGTVTALGTNPARIFYDTGRTELTDLFGYGKIEWLDSGNLNAGLTEGVISYDPDSKRVRLYRAMPYAIEVGQTYQLTQGCDRKIATCANRFANAINFRGEPWIPTEGELPLRQGPKARRRAYDKWTRTWDD